MKERKNKKDNWDSWLQQGDNCVYSNNRWDSWLQQRDNCVRSIVMECGNQLSR